MVDTSRSRSGMLGRPSADLRLLMRAEAESVDLAAGENLFAEGDPGDALYCIVSGSLGVYVAGQAGELQLKALIRPGETVGEMALISGEPRSATVTAIRDSSLLRLSQARFNRLLRERPEFMAGLNRILVHRLRASSQGARLQLEPRAVALVPMSAGIDVPAIAERLAKALRADNLRVAIAGADAKDQSGEWFQRLEQEHDHLLFCAALEDADWLRRCCRQADRIVVLADAGGPAVPAFPVDPLRQRAAHQLVDLVLLHPSAAPRPRSTEQWRSAIPASRHFHLRVTEERDWQRIGRVNGGRGVGLVLSGGGARAYAHIGVLQAFREAQIPIDCVGGASMGAIVGAGIALEWTLEELAERVRSAFARSNPLSDFTLPHLGLISGRKVDRLLEHNFGDVDIADLWMPYFCVSSNLTTAQVHVHRSGLLNEALRASVALPGILPPSIRDEGVLVDGAVLNNLPVDIMRHTHRGPIAAVDVSRDLAISPQSLRKEISGGVINRVLSPPIVSILMRSGTVTAEEHNRRQAKSADVAIVPRLGAIELRDWRAFDRAVQAGYEEASRVLAEKADVLLRRRSVTL
jgi:NTE family protein